MPNYYLNPQKKISHLFERKRIDFSRPKKNLKAGDRILIYITGSKEIAGEIVIADTPTYRPELQNSPDHQEFAWFSEISDGEIFENPMNLGDPAVRNELEELKGKNKDKWSWIVASGTKRISRNDYLLLSGKYSPLEPEAKMNAKKICSQLDEVILEEVLQRTDSIYLEQLNSEATIETKNAFIKVRKASQKTIKTLKNMYTHTCQICNSNYYYPYGVNLSEAHHIEPFSTSLNHHPSNIVILCPNHHRLMHQANAKFDRNRQLFVYENGYEEHLTVNYHL